MTWIGCDGEIHRVMHQLVRNIPSTVSFDGTPQISQCLGLVALVKKIDTVLYIKFPARFF
jgi:hypothetical protein